MTSGTIRAVGASVIGRGHKAAGTVRQDSFEIASAGQFLVAIAADGLGSAQFSHAASRFACSWAGKRIARSLRLQGRKCTESDTKNLVREALLEVAYLLNRAEERGAPGPMYTTVLGAICAPTYTVAFNFGDGAVIVFDCKGGQYVQRGFLGPEHGDYSGEVFPLLPEGFDDHLRIAATARAERVLIATDGVADFALLDDETDLKAEFALSFNNAMSQLSADQASHELVNYLSSDRASSINADDKTLLWLEL